MKTFDELLEDAFDAGRARGQDENLGRDGYFVTEMAPTFAQWRQTIGDPA